MFRFCMVGIAVLCLACGVGPALAEPVNIPVGWPDVFSAAISINYDAGTDEFTATGYPLQYNVPPASPITPGTFQIHATIDENGVPFGGSLLINGTTTGGSGSGVFETLLAGDLVDFGFTPDANLGDPPGAPTFQFVYDITSGALRADYGGEGSRVVIYLSSSSTAFTGRLNVNFSNDLAVADAYAVVPEPMSLSFMVAGALALAVRRRRSAKGSRTRGIG